MESGEEKNSSRRVENHKNGGNESTMLETVKDEMITDHSIEDITHSQEDIKKNGETLKMYWLPIGIALGTAMGASTGRLSLWLSLGIVLGLLLSFLSRKN